jgi:hypothetical protein
MAEPGSTTSAARVVFDPYFIQTFEEGATDAAQASTIRTSRLIVLTQQKALPKTPAKAVHVSETGDLTVYGDVVRVYGIFQAPGRTIQIVCRQLEFHPGIDGTSGIVVTGKKGDDAAAKELAADAGTNGNPRLGKEARAGGAATPGADGAPGKAGNQGGKIRIYCGNLLRYGPVTLNANGGRAGNGAAGQQGGTGGNGADGFYLDDVNIERRAAYGGQGGVGGNGGDGGVGGRGGSIELYVLNLDNDPDLKHKFTFAIKGGDGGDGGQVGKGGKGGNGGTPDDQYGAEDSWLRSTPRPHWWDGADSGGGGICGVPGYGGPVGAWGTVIRGGMLRGRNYFNGRGGPEEKWWSTVRGRLEAMNASSVNILKRARAELPHLLPTPGTDGNPPADPDECAPPGTPGAACRGYLGNAEFAKLIPGAHGLPGQPNKIRKTKELRKSPWPPPPTAPYSSVNVSLKDVAVKFDTEQLEMLLDHVRARYLLTDIHTASDQVQNLFEVLQWLVLVADCRNEKALLASASATLENLRNKRNIFGRGAKFAVLGSLQEYKQGLSEMLRLFAPVEETYRQLSADLNDVAERQLYLKNVLIRQDDLIEQLREMETEKLHSLKVLLGEIKTLEASRDDLAVSLAGKFEKLKLDVGLAIGLTGADFCSVLNQLSFTNRDTTNKAGDLVLGGVAAAGAMISSQIGDLFTKAVDNVTTDTGAPLNKKLVIRRVEFLSKQINSIDGLKQARDGLIKTDPKAEYRLLATREQVEAICSNFYEKYPEARRISWTLDDYIEGVTARNEKVEEYNQELSHLCYIRAELDKTTAHRNQVDGSLQKSANPGLPAMAKFSSALHKHARERCIEQLYMASRVQTLKSLELYDVFPTVLGKLASEPGEIDSKVLNTALIDLISTELEKKWKPKTNPDMFVPDGAHCSVTLTKEKNTLLFAMLNAHQPGTFLIQPPGPQTEISRNPFAGMADVRLTNIRCTAKGMKTTDNVHVITIKHPGQETFVDENGRSVVLTHNKVVHQYRYNAKTGSYHDKGALDEDHRLIGPFCEWELDIEEAWNKDLDLTELESIKVEFEGVYRSFVK